ncbi:MAG: BTAD domain-containing putative transcriptional regulator, partial [Jatrophihabitantaceae bacterium]
LHERLHGLLALALYRSGRQADALDRLARLRRMLSDELGVDPTPETAELELRLLRQEVDLVPPPVRAVPELRLPTPSSTLLGRDGEVAALLEQLRAPGVVTLTGSPGSGKTRLALEIARRLQAEHRRVAWADLAPLSEPDAVGPALATAAAVDAGPDDPVARLAGELDGALLVVDNAEHLIEPIAALVASVLRIASRLAVLVTSQRPLLISGEEIHHVGPLLPAAAAALFCERSGLPRDAQVDAICAAVDCLPLGVELAAGLTRTLSVDQLARRIDDRLRLLVGGSRDAGGRHTSLRAALDWSYRLLDATSSAVLARLAVFAGGCTLEAAEFVIAGDGIAPRDIAAALAELADRCLVVVSERAGSRRFGLLESVRDYALQRLIGSSEETGVRERHLAWCVRHVAEHDVYGEDEAAAVAAVFEEWPNLLSALENAPGTPRASDGLRLAIALDDAWMFRGLHDQARRHYAVLVDADGATDGERAKGLSNYAFASTLVGATKLAAELLDRASRFAEAAGEPELRMRVLYHRGIVALQGGWPRQAFEPLRQGEQIAAGLGRDRSVSAFQDVVASAHLHAGDAQTAARMHHAANEIDRKCEHLHGLVRGLVNEATALLALGDLTEAARCAIEGSEYATDLGDLVASATLRAVHGHVALARGEISDAVEHFRLAIAPLAPDEIDAQMCRLDLADALLHAGDHVEAREIVDTALAATRDRGVVWLVVQPTLAATLVVAGEDERAAEIVQATAQEYAERGFALPSAVGRLDYARALLAGSPHG